MTGFLLGAGRVARPPGRASITDVAGPLGGPPQVLGEPLDQRKRLLRAGELGLEPLGLLAALLVPFARVLGHYPSWSMTRSLKKPGPALETAVNRPPPSIVGRNATHVSKAWSQKATSSASTLVNVCCRACSSPSPSATISEPFGNRKSPIEYSTSHGGNVAGRCSWMNFARRTSSAEPSVSVLPSFRAMNATFACGAHRASQEFTATKSHVTTMRRLLGTANRGNSCHRRTSSSAYSCAG